MSVLKAESHHCISNAAHLNRLTDQKIISQSNNHPTRYKIRFNLCPNKGKKRITAILTWSIFLLSRVVLRKVSIPT